MFLVVTLLPALTWFGIKLAETGLWIDIWNQEVAMSREALFYLIITTYMLYNEVVDNWDQIEPD
mgnify:CR=1 FL=1